MTKTEMTGDEKAHQAWRDTVRREDLLRYTDELRGVLRVIYERFDRLTKERDELETALRALVTWHTADDWQRARDVLRDLDSGQPAAREK